MAKCGYPIADTLRSGKKVKCTTKGKFPIIFQGKKIVVCGFHRCHDGKQ